jgi:peptide/nickel transport system permease protein
MSTATAGISVFEEQTTSSLWVGLLAVGIGTVAGTIVGLMSGYWEGWLDLVLQRVDEKEIDCPWSCARFVGFCIIRPALMTSLPSWHRRTM